MVVRPTVTDAEGFGKELVAASPDLLGSMVKAVGQGVFYVAGPQFPAAPASPG
ncbi:hypothetical protein [Protofrankia symbiont of Coriaria ruscifolia]|uniref:Uncharacterized protein n=1 Tax=Candidatus Protofrankia californiensis TaxID=1839754 RepID=A0A1C3NUV7_9ACTN|nr:hypothetical protein [Protofrankia symbiont of Coriaria ruscifolia]SBW19193.1 hypothetical protein FDG2_1023 [Candidatus Protofrankia californiensis]